MCGMNSFAQERDQLWAVVNAAMRKFIRLKKLKTSDGV